MGHMGERHRTGLCRGRVWATFEFYVHIHMCSAGAVVTSTGSRTALRTNAILKEPKKRRGSGRQYVTINGIQVRWYVTQVVCHVNSMAAGVQCANMGRDTPCMLA